MWFDGVQAFDICFYAILVRKMYVGVILGIILSFEIIMILKMPTYIAGIIFPSYTVSSTPQIEEYDTLRRTGSRGGRF